MQLITSRLILREWLHADLEPLARLNADAKVMRHFPATLTREKSDLLAATAQAHIIEHGFGPLAIERDGEFVGFAGLYRTTFAPWI